jgi:uncharacterized membrane protein YqjE
MVNEEPASPGQRPPDVVCRFRKIGGDRSVRTASGAAGAGFGWWCAGIPGSDVEEVSAVAADAGDQSTSDLVSQAAAQISTLVRDELALAKTELAEKGKRAGLGGGLFGGAAVLALYGLGLLLALAVVLLDLVWPLWLAVLAVTVVVFAAAGVAALIGKQQLKSAAPPVPSDAIAGVEADVQTVKTAVREGRTS